MQELKSRDMIAGILLILTGLIWAGYAVAHYELGSLRRLGPGMFPTALGILLAGFGAAILVQALRIKAAIVMPRVSGRTLGQGAIILGSIISFALVLPRFGLLPAVAVLSLIATIAGPPRSMKSRILLALVLCTMAWAIFSLGLRMTTPLWHWPF